MTHDALDLRRGRTIGRDELSVRRLRPADRPFVEAVGRALSAESLRLRFGRVSLAPERHLGWIDEVGGSQHVAYGVSEARTGRPVALARYVLDLDRPGEAEIAVAVVDEWQGRGVGRIALWALRDHGRADGVAVARALVRSDNSRAPARAVSVPGASMRRTGRSSSWCASRLTGWPRRLGGAGPPAAMRSRSRARQAVPALRAPRALTACVVRGPTGAARTASRNVEDPRRSGGLP